eukprot:12214700-Alexandrium_andersonii.AAC.1
MPRTGLAGAAEVPLGVVRGGGAHPGRLRIAIIIVGMTIRSRRWQICLEATKEHSRLVSNRPRLGLSSKAELIH